MERVIIVDENDNFVRVCERNEWIENEIHRVSALWISNSSGEILLAQRSLAKRHGSGKWGPATAGTLNEGETYESNVLKEALEEIGLPIDLTQLELGPKELINTGNNRRFQQWFMVRMDMALDSLRLQEEEVAAVRWISPSDLENDLKRIPDTFIGAIETFPALIEWTRTSL